MNSRLGDYLSPEQRERRTAELAEAASGELVGYGQSVLGRALWAVRVPCTRAGIRPRVLCAANIHGEEYVSAHVALGFLLALGGNSGLYASLREKAEVWVIPCLNPDGYARTFECDGAGPLAQLRTNARGVDLNRNFPLPLGARPSRIPGAGSRRVGAITYRGEQPLSEPETRSLDRLMIQQQFHAVLSLHSFMGTLIPAKTADRQEFSVYRRLCAQFARQQPRWKYWRLASRRLDVFTGELEDHAHHVQRAWSSCVETFPVLHSLRQHLHAPSLFWRFNPRRLPDYVENDVPGLAGFFLDALTEPRPGFGDSGLPLEEGY